MEEKQTRWTEKLNKWYFKFGYPMSYAISAFLENKGKSIDEICTIIEKEKIPAYYARIESYKTQA